MKKLLVIIVLLSGCTQEIVEPEEKEEMLCLFKRNPIQTDPSCIPNCPPHKSFVKCIEKWEAYQYPGRKDWIIEENCGKCD